ncbi:MAG: cell division protein FtsA [Chloroflexi bacterium]|nr:cell division protein FtsA [Chloroflexota bacterium]
MYNEDIRLAIDVGSSKVCSVVIRRDNFNEPEMLAIDVLPSESIHDGDVMNTSEATAAVRASVSEVSKQCSLNFTKGYVGFGGKHVNSYTGWGRVSGFDFASGVIEEDIVQAVRLAASERVEATDHLLYATPTAYRVDDGTEFRKPPIGMHPESLEVQALLVVSDMQHYRTVFDAVSNAGITPIHGGSTLVAEAEHLLSSYERDAGVVLIDIGGSDTEIAIYNHGRAMVFNSLPIGGFHFTNDIAYAYELPFENAEAVKISAGTLVGDTVGFDDEIDPTALTGSERVIDVERSLTRVSVSNLLRDRASETMDLYKSRIAQVSGLPDTDFLTVVFTGGGSKLTGIETYAKLNMGLRGRVEVRKPTGIKSLPDDVSDPSMSGAICMALRALDRIERDNHVERKPITVVHTNSDGAESPQHTNGSENEGVGAKIRSLLGR